MKKIVSFGELMMRLSPPNFGRFVQATQFELVYGGSEANILASLANFGLPTRFITALPSNELGAAAKQALHKLGIDTSLIQFREGRLGLYFAEKGAVMRPSKIIYDRYDSAFAQIDKNTFDWEQIFAEAQWFHWSGITPALSESCASECLKATQVAKQMGLTVSGDIYFRSGLWKYQQTPQEILPQLVENTDLLLCDEAAMESYLSIEINPKAENTFIDSAQRLMQKFPQIKKVIDTQRESISASHNILSASLWNGKQFFKSQSQEITHIIDRIGGGDAFFAGLMYGLLTFQDEQQALDFGVCASALKHTIEGDINLATVEEIEALRRGDKSGRIMR